MENKYKIIIEKFAQRDLINIYEYISKTLFNEHAAIKLLNKISDQFELIQFFPHSAPLINNPYIENKNIRKLSVDNYVIFYEVDDIMKEIKIIRIIHRRMNFLEVL